MHRLAATLAGFLLLALPTTASALCGYAGVLYLRPTLHREFADADHVVRVRVESEVSSHGFPGVAEDDPPWVAYRLLVLDDFKGTAPSRLTYLTMRDSGAFYLGGAGEEFLLFLGPSQADTPDMPSLAAGAFSSNYCGNSRSWAEVTADERRTLARLAGPP